MAQLPGDNISPSGTQGFEAPKPDRPMVSYKGGIAQQAGISAGEGIGQLGKTALGAVLQVQQTHDRLAAAAAEQDFISKKLDIDQQFAQDPDYQTAPQRYRAAMAQAAQAVSGSITSPTARADLQNRLARWTEYGVNEQLRSSTKKWADAGRADTMAARDTALQDSLRAPDETHRTAIFTTASDRFDLAAQSGWITRTEAVTLKKQLATGYAKGRAIMLADNDPTGAVKALQPTGVSADGTPVFDKTGDWRDMLDPIERMQVVKAAQEHADAKARAAEVDAMRKDRLEQKAKQERAEAAGNTVVTQMLQDPTKVDPKAISASPDLTWEQKYRLHEMLTHELTKGGATDHDDKTYGKDFWTYFNRVHAADNDPQKITDPTQLYQYAGPNGGLTVAGVEKLSNEIIGKRTPDGEAEAMMKKQFLLNARNDITGSSEGLGLKDRHGDELFLKFMATALPAYEAGRKAGKSPAQLLNPESPDYIGKSIKQFKRDPAQWNNDIVNDNDPGAPGQDPGAKQQNVMLEFKAGRIDRAEAIKRLNALGIPSRPQAAAEPPSAPIAVDEGRR